jgi:hypothetical protein
MIATTRRMWIRPPIVYDVATPSNHSTMRTVTIVVSTAISFRSAVIVGRVGGDVCSVGYTRVAWVSAMLCG